MNIFKTNRLAIIFIALCTIAINQASAQKVDVKFRTRAVVDLGYFGYDKYQDRAYPGISDLRMGAGIKWENLSFKGDIGISGKQIGIKDFFLDWKINDENAIRFGHGFEAMSIGALTGGLDLAFNNFSLPVSALTTPRRLGATYMYNTEHYYGAAGIYSDNSVNALFNPTETSNAVSISTRHLYKNTWNDKSFLQVGGSVAFRTIDQSANYSAPSQFVIATEGFANLLGFDMQEAIVKQAKSNIKAGAELFGTFNRFRVQAEYLASCVTRNETLSGTTPAAYVAHGGYAQFSYLLNKKGKYKYDRFNATGLRSDVGSIELNARLDYLNLNSKAAEIYKGEQTNITLGVNWYFHKLFAVKWNVNYAFNDSHCNADFTENGFSTVARVQFSY